MKNVIKYICLLFALVVFSAGVYLLTSNNIIINEDYGDQTQAESKFTFQVCTKSYKAAGSETTKAEGSGSGQTSTSRVGGCFDVGWYENESNTKANFDAQLGYSGGSYSGNGKNQINSISAFYYYYYNWWGAVNRHGRIEINTYKSTADTTGWQFCGVDDDGSSTARSTSYTWYKFGSNAPVSSIGDDDKATNTMSGMCYVVYRYSYKLVYSANGGTNAPQADYFLSGIGTTITEQRPTREGYTFLGWSRSSTDTTPDYYGGDSFKDTTSDTSSSVYLYAVWQKNGYNVRFDETGSSYSSTPYVKEVTIPNETCGYPFVMNSNGYYESTNNGVNNSFALCKVTFSLVTILGTTGSVSFSVINFAESNYDYGIFSNLDTTLSASYTADSTNVYKSFKGNSSSSVQTVTYSNVSGSMLGKSHFIYIKYRKDGSNSNNNDSLQFKLTSMIAGLGVVSITNVENIAVDYHPFVLNSSGYYESTNKGLHSSYSLCKFSFYVPKTTNVTLNVISYGESNYDYGIFSNLDTTLSASYTADSANVYKSYKGLSSSSVQTLTYSNVSAGTHYICIKYIKDSSGNSNNDSLKFKLSEGTTSTWIYDVNQYKSNPSKTGYTFDGWTATNLDTTTARRGTSSSTVTTTWTSGSTKVTSTYFKNLNSDMGTVTLTANWTANGYTLTADVNEPNTGTFLNKVSWTLPSGWSSSSDKSYATKTVKYDSQYGTLPTPSREGYTFDGWYDASSGGNKISSSNNNDVMNSTSGKTIYAHWTAKSYTLTANANGGSIPSTSGWSVSSDKSNATKTVKYDSTYGTLPTPTKEGYTFAGWYTASSGGDTVSTSTKMDNINGKTIYAHWTANKYSVVFDKNGGSGSMSNQIMTYDKASNLTTNTYTRQGYYFVGWSKTKLGVQSTIPTSNIYKDGESVKNLVASGSVTLYAVWLDTWANHATTPTGSGSSTSPYIIDSAEDLAWMINNHGSVLKYFKQTKVINLSKYNWYPIGTSNKPFKGVYNGQGYEITNLNIPEITNASGNKIQSNIGLFGYTSGGEITGIYIKNATIYGKDNVGLIVSNATSTKINSNIIESSKVYASGNYGAVAGKISGGEIKYNLVYVTTNGGTSTSSLYTGSTTLSTNLVENNGTRSKVGTEDLTGWGKVFNRLLPSAISWGAQVFPITSADFTNWVNKTIN